MTFGAILPEGLKWHFLTLKCAFGVSGFRGSVGGPGDCKTLGPSQFFWDFIHFFGDLPDSSFPLSRLLEALQGIFLKGPEHKGPFPQKSWKPPSWKPPVFLLSKKKQDQSRISPKIGKIHENLGRSQKETKKDKFRRLIFLPLLVLTRQGCSTSKNQYW